MKINTSAELIERTLPISLTDLSIGESAEHTTVGPLIVLQVLTIRFMLRRSVNSENLRDNNVESV